MIMYTLIYNIYIVYKFLNFKQAGLAHALPRKFDHIATKYGLFYAHDAYG